MRRRVVMGILLAGLRVAYAGPMDDCRAAKEAIELAGCIGAHVQRLEARIDRIGVKVRAGLVALKPPDELKPPTGIAAPGVRFDAAATAWGRYRDAECESQAATWTDADVEPVMRMLCRANLATARLTELKQAYKDVLATARER